MLFTKRSQIGAQIEPTKGFDPVQKTQPSAGFFVSVLESSPKAQACSGRDQRKRLAITSCE